MKIKTMEKLVCWPTDLLESRAFCFAITYGVAIVNLSGKVQPNFHSGNKTNYQLIIAPYGN